MSNEARFNLIIAGELVPGAAPEAVRNNLAALFKVPTDKAQALLATKPRVIQKGIDQATAMKWRAVLQRAGLKSTIEALEAAAQESASLPHEETSANMEMVGTIRTGGDEFVGPFEVAEVGADIADPKDELPALVPSTEHLSMAPVGSDIETLKEEKNIVTPDTSHLSFS